jgi:hypothetical protein
MTGAPVATLPGALFKTAAETFLTRYAGSVSAKEAARTPVLKICSAMAAALFCLRLKFRHRRSLARSLAVTIATVKMSS